MNLQDMLTAWHDKARGDETNAQLSRAVELVLETILVGTGANKSFGDR